MKKPKSVKAWAVKALDGKDNPYIWLGSVREMKTQALYLCDKLSGDEVIPVLITPIERKKK